VSYIKFGVNDNYCLLCNKIHMFAWTGYDDAVKNSYIAIATYYCTI